MSSKSQHVQDNAVVERRLRPIYDWLDIGNNKKALQECDKVLKKTPNLHCAKALKALTLHRMGKEQMAVQILDDLAAEKPIDEATLQAMTLCYRELQQLDKICKLYETAVKLDPTNEELHTHLFMSYARIFDFKSQQQTAMQLYKFKPKTPYYCWAVMSLILQATRGNHHPQQQQQNTNNNNNNHNNNNKQTNSDCGDHGKRLLLLNLAERMMDKLINENKLDAEQEIQLYLMILELQSKFEEILKVLDGPLLGGKLVCSNLPQNKMKYLKKLQLWYDVNLLCKSILVDHIDRWDIWKDYINSVFELIDRKNNKETTINHENHETTNEMDENADDTPEKCHEFICRIVENTSDNGYALRGPYLARFELYKKLLERNLNPIELLGDLIELFIEYYRKFGSKSSCVNDLRLYLNLLTHEQQYELTTMKLLKECNINSTNLPKTIKQLQNHLTTIQLQRLCGIHMKLTNEHLLALITSFSLHYQHGYQQYGRNLLQTDLGPFDQYAILATHLLYDLAILEQQTKPIIVGLILLEQLLKNSPSNFHAKLLSIRLYHTIGGTLGAQNMYNSLDLKHLQLDSLGFIHCARLPTTGLFSLYTNLCDTTLKFFSSNYKDSSDHITFSYKYGSFIKLDEFMDFRERLNNSIHYTTVAIDRIVLTLMDCTNLDVIYNLDISPKDDKIDWDNLRDNHDLNVYISWDPERIDYAPEDRPEIQQLFKQDVDYLKLRTNILWSLSNCVFIIKSQDGQRTKHIDNLKNILTEWEQFNCEVKNKNYTPLRQDQVTLPLPSRLHAALEVNHFDILINCFQIFYNIANETYTIDELLSKTEDCFKGLLGHLKDKSRQQDITANLIERRLLMEHIVNSVEIVSISCLVCLLCNDLSKPRQQQSKKNRKHHQSGGNVTNHQTTNHRRDWLINFVNVLKCAITQLGEIVDDLANRTIEYDLATILETLNLNQDDDNSASDGGEVSDNITKSYQYACREVQRVLQSKLKMLNCV